MLGLCSAWHARVQLVFLNSILWPSPTPLVASSPNNQCTAAKNAYRTTSLRHPLTPLAKQGAWRNVCALQVAHRKHIKGSSVGQKSSSDARRWDLWELSSHDPRRSRRRRRCCHDEPDFEATFAADVSRMCSNGSKGLYRRCDH